MRSVSDFDEKEGLDLESLSADIGPLLYDLIASSIWHNIYAPKGDPLRHDLYAAACLVKIMGEDSVDKDTVEQLRGENQYEHDFLKQVENDFTYN